METKGKVIVIYDTIKKSDKFSVREFVIETEDKYPQKIIFQCLNDRIDYLNRISEGDMVNVKFNLTGREYNGKYYNSLNAWDIRAIDDNADVKVQVRETQKSKFVKKKEEDSDLPF